MPSIDLLIPFAIATISFAVLPGPALLYTAARTLAGGRRAGLAAVLGIHLGGYAHVIAAALGLSAIFAHVPTAYLALKLAGAGYLLYLGVRLVLSALRRDAPTRLPDVGRKTARRTFLESVAVEVLNPKAALFFIAFLPQFADPSAAWPLAAQLLVLGVIVNFAFSAADVAAVYLADGLARAARRGTGAERIAKLAGGSILVGLGVHLATSRGS